MPFSGSSGKSCRFWQKGDARLSAWLVPTSSTPDKRMPVIVPVGGRPLDRLFDLGPRLEATALQGQRAQHLPPGFDQVEVGRVLGLEHELPARMQQAEQQGIGLWMFRLSSTA